ncbi:hypothetical protein DVH05_014863 [Phytophthora capsici]|nr:hypothetical protein DVH05_014863 [Phytophthora capsici]
MRDLLIKDAMERCEVLDNSDIRPQLKCFLHTILKLVLEKMGFDLIDNNSFTHCAGWESEPIYICLDFNEENDELDTKLCYKEDVEPIDSFAVLNSIKCSDIARNWLTLLLMTISKLLPLPQRAALLIIGDHLNSPIMRAHFLHDATILERATDKIFPSADAQTNARCLMQQTEDGRRLLKTRTEEGMPIVYNHVIPGSEPFELLLVDNPTKSQFERILKLFFSTGYRQRTVMFSGHGDPDGKLVCRQSVETMETEDTNKYIVSMSELLEWTQDSLASVCLPSAGGCKFILNSCFSHKLIRSAPNASLSLDSEPASFTLPYKDVNTNIQFFPCSDVNNGAIPAGGILELIKNDKLNGIQKGIIDNLLGWASNGIKELPLFQREKWLEWYALGRKYNSNVKPVFIWEVLKQDAVPGLYVFPADRGDTYVLMLNNRHAVLIDSGFDQHIFADCCWNKFMVPYVDTFDVILTHVDADHIKGFLYLVHEAEFNQQGPKCKRLFMNTPDNQPHRASYTDGQAIADKLKKLGIPVISARSGDNKILGEVTLANVTYKVDLKIVAPGADDKDLQKNHGLWEKAGNIGKPRNAKKAKKTCDKSVSNLSSIVSLISLRQADAQEAHWLGLFAADSTQEKMKDGLQELRLKLPFEADIITIPHHGSHYNSNKDFSEQFVARQAYIVSTTGYHHKSDGIHLPNSKALQACGDSEAKLYCPYKFERDDVTFQHGSSVLDYKDFPTVTKGNYTSIMQKLEDKPKPWIFFKFEGR